MEGLSTKEKGLMDMDNSVVIAGVEGALRGQNGNGKNTIKIKKINKDSFKKSLFSFPFLFFTF